MRVIDFSDGFETAGAPSTAGAWTAPDGGISAPGIAWNSDPDTGFYRVGSDNFAAVCGGIGISYWDNAGLRVGNTAALVGNESLTVQKRVVSGAAASNNYGTWIRYLNDTNTAFSGEALAVVADFRRTITSDTTDTSSYSGAILSQCYFNIASTKTFTHAADIANHWVYAPGNTGAGALAIARYSGINIEASSLATGTRKYGIKMGAQTGATNNVLISDSTSFSGNYATYLESVNPNYFAGPMCFGSQDVASAASITGMACAASITRLTGVTATSLHGITAGKPGQLMIIRNLTSANLTFKNDSGTEGTAANRISTCTGADVATTGDSAHLLFYDGTSTRWILMGGQV